MESAFLGMGGAARRVIVLNANQNHHSFLQEKRKGSRGGDGRGKLMENVVKIVGFSVKKEEDGGDEVGGAQQTVTCSVTYEEVGNVTVKIEARDMDLGSMDFCTPCKEEEEGGGRLVVRYGAEDGEGNVDEGSGDQNAQKTGMSSGWRAKRRAQREALEAEEAAIFGASNHGINIGVNVSGVTNGLEGIDGAEVGAPKLSAAKRIKLQREQILNANTSRSARRVARGADKLGGGDNGGSNAGDDNNTDEVREDWGNEGVRYRCGRNQ
jgi:hypothetical protein